MSLVSQISNGFLEVATDVNTLYETKSTVYTSRQALIAALPAMVNGDEAFVGPVRYKKDTTANNYRSAMFDIGVNGVVAPENPLNAYIAAWFADDNTGSCLLYTSPSPRDRG